MKKLFYLLLALPLAFAACEPEPAPTPEPDVKEPVLTTYQESIDFNAEGGEGTITYAVENAVEGTTVAATCEAKWVSDITVAETITFTVAANEGEARETKVVVTYGELKNEVAVKQAAKGEEPKTPAFEAVTAEVEYDWNVTMGEVEYKLENPIEGVEVKAKAGADWISQVQVKDGKIMFAMTENTGDAREGKITAEYGMLPAIEFTVKQKAYVAPAPVLNVAEAELEFQPEGGDGSFAYTLENPAEGVELVATANVEWISNVVAANGTVSFTVAANEGAIRSGIVSLTYGELKAEVAITQLPAGYNPDMTYVAYKANYSKAVNVDNKTWELHIWETDATLGTMYTRFVLNLAEANQYHIPTGTYSTADGSIVANDNSENKNGSYYRYNSTGAPIANAEINFTLDKENSKAVFNGKFVIGNTEYSFEWDGAVDGLIYEEIGEEGITDWTVCYIYSQYGQNVKYDTSNLWMKASAGITFSLYVRNSDNPLEKAIAAGTYPVGAWDIRVGVSEDSKINDTNIASGEMVVEMIGEQYKITFDFVDKNGNEYKGSYTGDLPYTDYTHP